MSMLVGYGPEAGPPGLAAVAKRSYEPVYVSGVHSTMKVLCLSLMA
jgi:hypothetical protein